MFSAIRWEKNVRINRYWQSAKMSWKLLAYLILTNFALRTIYPNDCSDLLWSLLHKLQQRVAVCGFS